MYTNTMVTRPFAGQISPRRREPPRIRCCLPLWRGVVIVPFLLIIHFLYVLTKIDISTLQESSGMAEHYHLKHLRDSFQSPQQQQQSSVTKASPTIPNIDDYLTKLKTLEKTLNAKSCQRRNDKKDDFALNENFCSGSSATNFVYHNSLPFERILCGQIIPPNSHITTNQICNSPARLFEEIPQITGNMKPVHLFFRVSSQNRAKPFPCDIPCHSVEGGGVVQTRYVTPIDNSEAWKITFSMEGPMYYRQLAIQDGEYKKHHYYSTTSYESEVPLPYFSWAEYDIHSPSPVDFDTAIKGASFMAKNCASRNKREALVQELSQHFRVDALSLCLHNAEPPPGANLRDKVQTMRFYLFHLAFENQCYPDYITEKLWGPMQSGTIPVYFGSPNAKDHAPNNSLIMVDDFPDVATLGKYLNEVAKNLLVEPVGGRILNFMV
ncbi:galactoside 3-L-fucosyltransferase 11 [Fistulifera solaris]|uniref:Fucosyltransferase n=1 Tax=Fistulifera solaris TaxID=1519565 RepID=A0A1Z5JT16_FISSO|nr:galactoside 3-L-fucosyltransferase 11 [Fistulifera solaris]|eukprot:GAX17170.1 galactoside 3-L-fucosyltransferase 11 [Fistulifera solaris]